MEEWKKLGARLKDMKSVPVFGTEPSMPKCTGLHLNGVETSGDYFVCASCGAIMWHKDNPPL